MKRTFLLLAALALLALIAPPAQAAKVVVSVPTVRFTVAPALVTIAPGIQVVPSLGTEVFFSAGYYWTFHSGHWHRAKSWKSPKWTRVKLATAPAFFHTHKHGTYANYVAKKKAKRKRKAVKRTRRRHKR